MERLAAIEPAGDAVSQRRRAAALAAETSRGTGALFSAILVITASPIEATGPDADCPAGADHRQPRRDARRHQRRGHR